MEKGLLNKTWKIILQFSVYIVLIFAQAKHLIYNVYEK